MKTFVFRAVEAVCDLLCNMPSVQVESVKYERKIGRTYNFRLDGLVEFNHGGNKYSLIIEVKSNGAPRFVRSAIYQLESYVARLRRSSEANGERHFIPIIVSPYLSPASRAICLDHDTAYLDLMGNARLAFDTVYIERAVSEKPVSETRSLRSIFSPKAAAILRVLLREPGRAWRVADLAAQARASYGHVSNVRKALLAREWIEVGEDGIVLVQPDTLLNTWRESYRRPAGRSIPVIPISMERNLRNISKVHSTRIPSARVRCTRCTQPPGGSHPSVEVPPKRSTQTNQALKHYKRC